MSEQRKSSTDLSEIARQGARAANGNQIDLRPLLEEQIKLQQQTNMLLGALIEALAEDDEPMPDRHLDEPDLEALPDSGVL